MKTKIPVISFTLMVAVLLSVLFYACKKNDLGSTVYTDAAATQRITDNVKAQLDKWGGIPQKVELNQRMKVGFADMNGNLVNPQFPANITSVCAGDLPNYMDLNYYYRLYQCWNGYKVVFAWTISWDNNVVLINPNNAANYTRGTIKVSITGNANAYNKTTKDVTITDLGIDGAYPGSELFFVEMRDTELIPYSVVTAPGATLRLGAFIASDCSTLDNYSIAPMGVTGFGFSTVLNNDPCTRNDKCWFQLPGMVGYRQLGIAGYDPTSSCSSYTAGSAPSYQEAQYSTDNGATWNNYVNFTSPYSNIINTQFFSRLDFGVSTTLSPGTYNVVIRYRNYKFTSGGTPLNTLPTSGNSCITPVWSYEYYPGVVVT
jgi:hypothetical protein